MLIAVYLASTIAAAIRSEEAFLRRTFGDGYRPAWRRRAEPRGVAPLQPGAGDANREYRAVLGCRVALLLLLEGNV